MLGEGWPSPVRARMCRTVTFDARIRIPPPMMFIPGNGAVSPATTMFGDGIRRSGRFALPCCRPRRSITPPTSKTTTRLLVASNASWIDPGPSGFNVVTFTICAPAGTVPTCAVNSRPEKTPWKTVASA